MVERINAVTARQRSGKHVSAATNKHATIEEAMFPMRPLLGNGAVCADVIQRGQGPRSESAVRSLELHC
jgi:hypothetical protein